MLSVTMCMFSLCYLGRIKRTMARDIEFRITSLVASRCGAADTNSSDSGARASTESHRPDMERRLDHTARGTMSTPNAFDQDSPVNEIAEKTQFRDAQDFALYPYEPKRANIPQLDLGQGFNPNEESSGFDLYANSSAAPLACYSRKDEDVIAIPENQHYASLYGEDNGIRGSVPSIGIHAAHFPPSTTIPVQRTTAINGSAGAAEYAARLPYGNRMAALSFYDDLLATISSERMIYSTSLSNRRNSGPLQPCQRTEQRVKMDCNSSILSVQSSALCSSMHLTYGGSNENDERSILSRPVHPFDITDPSDTSVRLLPRSPTLLRDGPDTSINNTLVQPSVTLDISNGFQMGLSSRIQSQENLQSQNTYASVQKRSSRCGSSHSQDIIENWRIHVAPSPPTIPELYDDAHDTVTDRASTPTGIKNGDSSRDIGKDINLHNNTGCSDRRGTIPIILSSHLQDARTTNFVEEQFFFSAEDLEAPRPPYAYGQTRTQRQGSVNSSIGGYNYSTAASSPSLADSLSNPMYQEQSFGIMNSSTMLQPRPLAPRKGSLPTSLCSRPIMDDFRLTPGASQLHNQQKSYVVPPQAVPSRIRSNMPSQLSNMIAHSGNTAGYGMDVDYIHTPADGKLVQIPSQHQRGHVRSQSQSARSSGSSWDQAGIEDAKVGYTALMDIPTVTPSHMGYYTVQDDLFSSYSALRSSGIMGSREDLTTNNGSANISRNIFEPLPSRGEDQEHNPSKIYRNDMSDNTVHPLDLSPLLPQTHSRELSRSDAVANNGGAPRQDQAWDDTCVGLGLTFDLDHCSVLDSSDNEGSIFIHYPHERPAMATSMTSGFLTRTAHLHQASYSEKYTSMSMTTATTGNIFDAAFVDSSRSQTGTRTPVDNVDSVRGTMPHHDDYPLPTSTNTVDTSPASESRRGRPPQVQRQASQRNKKNLIVSIVPLQVPL
ncbi:hypothetical protein BGZ67_000855 [Mortierella alpina]|nr:hypothetical protein BGZ67_000855 [Mortierella alpina]